MILKRTLTRKSILGFGYFDVRDLSVQMMLDLGKHSFLINAYFNLDKIDFIDDVLTELGITNEWRIEKPNKNIELGKKFYEDKISKMTDKERIEYYSVRKSESKHRYATQYTRSTSLRADNLRAKNHGNK